MIILLLFLNSLLFSQNYDAKFEKANKLYNSEKYESAIKIYEELLTQDIKSSQLYYNLANSYYRNDQIGLAILNYNKALKLEPNFEDAEFNLEVAKLKTIDKFEEVPTFFLDDLSISISRMFNERQWTIVNIVICVGLFGFIALFRLTKSANTKRQILILIFGSIFLFLFSSYFGYKQYKYESTLTNGVISSASTYIKSSPDANSKDLIILHEGTSFELLDKVGDWVELKLSDGNKGWVNIKDIERY